MPRPAEKLNKFTIFLIIVLSILLGVPVLSYAGLQSMTYKDTMDGVPPLAYQETGAFAGKPISLVSGAETIRRTDLTIGNLYPISIARQYISKSEYDSPLGYGWSLSYDKRLFTAPIDGSFIVRQGSGQKQKFEYVNGQYVIVLYRYMSGCNNCLPPPPVIDTTVSLTPNDDGTYSIIYKNGEREQYDSFGRLVKMQDAIGNALIFYYELDVRSPLWGLLPANVDQTTAKIVAYDYRLSRIEEQNASGAFTNKYVLFHYDATTWRLTDIVDSAGRTITYGHDSIGNLTSVTGLAGNATYGYADPQRKHLMTTIDEGNGVYTNSYDTLGWAFRQTHGTGVIDILYNQLYKSAIVYTTVKDSAGNSLSPTITRSVNFDEYGHLAKDTDYFRNETRYTRTNLGWVTREEHWDYNATLGPVFGTATDFTYDDKGNMLTKTEAQGTSIEKATTYTYHPVFNLVTTETVSSVVDPAQDKVTTNTYDDANGNLLATTEQGLLGNGTPYTYTTTYTYDTNGKIATINGPRTDVSDITTYAYDSTTGYLTAITQPIIGTTIYSNFDPLGNPQTVIDPNGNATIYTYDVTSRVRTVKAPGDTAATQYFYVTGGCQSCGGGANKIDHITLPEGNTIWYTYDSLGNLSSIKDNANNSINYTYDSEGNKLTEQITDSSSALQKSLIFSYDQLNRLSKITNPDNAYTQYGYDARGNKTSLRNPNAALTAYSYDALNRLTSVFSAGTATTSYTYDTNNKLTSVKDANNNTTTYKMDDHGKVYQVISPDTGTTTYQYDPAGNLMSKTDAKGITISYVYDALNRLTNINFPSDTGIVYAYDTCVNGKGRLCSMIDASGTTLFEYTPKGQIKKETKTIDSHQYVTQYAYDQNGNLKTMTYPSGRVITYNMSNDKVISVLNNAANLATNINYKPFGGISSLTYGNGIAGTIGYDNQYRVSSITAGAVNSFNYNQYDSNGNIMAIQNTLDPTKNKAFTYDTLDRLSTAASSGIWGSLGWTYDGVGNRQTEGSTVYTYTAGTNKLSGAGSLNFGYDNNGNATSQAARLYTYNENQRLIQVNDGATAAYYTYNGNGQRVKKNVSGTITVFHYSLNGQIIAESNSAGNVTAEYVYLNGQPLAKIEGANTYYYHNDHLGTPQKMTDSAGVVRWSADYKPFGEAAVDQTSTITNNLRGIGQYFDVETGLLYNYFRDLNLTIGRYIEADPIGIVRGKNNIFAFVGSNPVNFVDPLGLDPLNPNTGSVNEVLSCHGLNRKDLPKFPKKKEKDYCGSGFTEPLVPDFPFGVNLQKTCEKHDACYGQEGAAQGQSRIDCDFNLKNDTWEACLKEHPGSPAACDGLGLTYYLGVRFFGYIPYKLAR